MSFLKRLFGGGGGTDGGREKKGRSEVFDGFTVTAMPMAEGSQFRLSAEISKEIDGATKTHRLIRADLFMSSDEANAAAFRKAQQVIKEQGERLFD